MSDCVSRSLTIVNEKGLHARASARLVEVVEAYDASAEVSRDGFGRRAQVGHPRCEGLAAFLEFRGVEQVDV